MAHDLSEVMHAEIAADESRLTGVDLTAGELRAVVGRTRRRRAIRHTVTTLVALPAVGLVGAAVWFGLGQLERPEPAVSPAPSPTEEAPTPGPSPSSSPTPSPDPTPGDVLPEAEALPEGWLDLVEPGWALSSMRPSRFAADDSRVTAGSAVYLSSPDGGLYLVSRLPDDVLLEVVRWEVGEPRALVRQIDVDENGQPAWTDVTWALLDIGTGTLEGLGAGWGSGPLGNAGHYLGLTADGRHLFREYAVEAEDNALVGWTASGEVSVLAELPGGWSWPGTLDPSGRRLAYIADDDGRTIGTLDTGDPSAATPVLDLPDKRCDLVAWFDAESLLALCENADRRYGPVVDPDAEPGYYRFDAVTGEVELVLAITEGVPVVQSGGGAHLSDGEVVLNALDNGGPEGYDPSSVGVYAWDGAEFRLLYQPDGAAFETFDVRAETGEVFLVSNLAFDTPAGWLRVLDPAGGSPRVLMPGLQDGADADWLDLDFSWAPVSEPLPG